ncbi:hypothetical protein N7488_011429 [Penicillium malachiteum]|nr:hypothetical protein N7488_011429 [Penicillium malachiteum]
MKFNKLPPELVLMIFRYLSPVDITCLALCNHYFMSCSSKLDTLLGKRWPGVRTGRSDDDLQIDLLTRLARNLPHTTFVLHAYDFTFGNICFDAIQDRNSSLLMKANLSLFPTYSFFKFHFVHLHLAMRRYYFGPSFGITAESLMYTEVNPYRLLYPRTSSFTCRTELKSIEARVCTNPSGLGIRMQSLAVVNRQDVQTIFDQKDMVQICNHRMTFSADSPDIYKSCLRSQKDEADGEMSQLCTQGKCDRCNTSWKLELREIEKQDVCLLLTRWKDLGPGLNPEDDHWRIEQFWAFEKTLEPSERVGDPRERFERLSECDSPQLLSQEDMFQRIIS